MRLFLSSSGFGRHGRLLVDMVGPGGCVAVIANALDNLPDLKRAYLHDTVWPLFEAYGFCTEELDLRDYFREPLDLEAVLSGFGLVWAIGGNAFLLRHAMKLSGFDQQIAPLLQMSSLVYGGWSAGSVVAGSDFVGIDRMDDPNPKAAGYPIEPLPRLGLQLVDGTVVPHYDSAHPEAQAADMAVKALNASRQKIITLREGEVLVHDGDRLDLMS